MTYATQQDLVERFGEPELVHHTDRTDSGQADATVIARALADAAALVDGYIGRRYALPLAAVDAVLVGLACDIARYKIHGDTVERDGAIVHNHRDAVARLRDIADGRLTLQGGGAAPAPAATGGFGITAPERLLTAAALTGF